MVEKKSSRQPDAIPKKPPGRPARDYSNLPQKPISLKQLGTKKKLNSAGKTEAKSGPATKQKKKVMPKKPVPRVKKRHPDQWPPQGISEEARAYARNQADRQGVSVGEWLERLIIDHRQSATGDRQTPAETDTREPPDEITETLHAIEQRLDRIEERRSFWSRFWDQVMKQAERREGD
jgi:hypothetical protein